MDEQTSRVLNGDGRASKASPSPFSTRRVCSFVLKQIRVFVCDVDGRYGKILDFRISPELGLIRCSKGDKCVSIKSGHYLDLHVTCCMYV